MHPAEANREAYIILDLRNRAAFIATAVWSLMYVAEAGYALDNKVDPASNHGNLETGLFVVPTGRQVAQDGHASLNFEQAVKLFLPAA